MDSSTIAELITILTAKVDQVQAGVDQATAQLDRYQDKAEEANKNVAETFDLAAVAVEYLAYELGEMIFDLGKEAAQIDAFRAGIGALARTVGVSNEQIVDAEAGIEALGYTEMQSTTTVTRLMQAHIGLSNAVGVAKAAMDYADANGRTYDDTLNLITQSILGGNAMALRQLGITTQIRGVFNDYAISLGKTEMALTDTERRQAILNTILKSATTVVGAHAEVLKTAAGQYEYFKEQEEQASYSLGKYFEPILSIVGTIGAKIMMAFKDMPSILQAAVAAMALFASTGALGLGGIALYLGALLPMISKVRAAFMALGASGGIIFIGLAAAITGVIVGLGYLEKRADEVNDKFVRMNQAINKGATVTFNQITSTEGSDPRAALELAKAREAFDAESLKNAAGLTDYAKQRITSEQELLQLKIKQLQAEVAELPPVKEHVATMKELVARAMDLNITQKMLATDTMQDILAKAKEYMAVNDLSYAKQVLYLSDLDRRFKLSAEQRAALAQMLAQLELKHAEDVKKAYDATWAHMAQSFASSVGQTVGELVQSFSGGSVNILQIWNNMITQMISDFVSSGILDLLASVTGDKSIMPTGGGLFGAIFGLGFDDPVNDAMAKHAGQGKWFQDFATNYSKGYVNAALASAPGMPSPAAAAGGDELHFHFHSTLPPSPSQARRAAKTVGNMLKRNGMVVA